MTTGKHPHYSPNEIIHATGIETNTFDKLYAQKIAQQTIYAYHRTNLYHIFRYRGNHNVHYVEDKKLKPNNNSLLIINRDILHRYSRNGCEGNMLAFSDAFFTSMQEKTDYLRKSALLTGSYVLIPAPSDYCLAAVDAYFDMIKKLQPYQKTDQRQKTSGSINQHYAIVLRNHVHNLLMTVEQEYRPYRQKLIAHSGKDMYMQQFKTLLNKHYQTEKQAEFYAETIGLTEKKLSSIIHSIHGYSTKQYISEKILREACWQLKFTTLSLSEIADKLGFDPTYFIKFFHKHTNITPAKYRTRS